MRISATTSTTCSKSLPDLTHRLVKAVFVFIEENQLRRLEPAQLPYQFGPDRAAGARDENPAAPVDSRQLFGILRLADAVPAEQVLHVHGPELANRHVAGHDLAEGRHRGGFDRYVRAAGHDLSQDRLRRARYAEDDFVNAVSANHRLQVVSCSEHLPAADGPALQGLVVVHEPDNFEIRIPQLAQQAQARFARASQQQTPADRRRGRGLFPCAGAIVKNAPGETPANQSDEHQERMNDQDTEGNRRAGKHAGVERPPSTRDDERDCHRSSDGRDVP